MASRHNDRKIMRNPLISQKYKPPHGVWFRRAASFTGQLVQQDVHSARPASGLQELPHRGRHVSPPRRPCRPRHLYAVRI
jgi:hypothetical protein